jgi:hypothetical protein
MAASIANALTTRKNRKKRSPGPFGPREAPSGVAAGCGKSKFFGDAAPADVRRPPVRESGTA